MPRHTDCTSNSAILSNNFVSLLSDPWMHMCTNEEKGTLNKTIVFQWAIHETSKLWVSAWWRSQWCGHNLYGPFLGAMLLMAVEVSARAMVASPEKYTWTTQIALLHNTWKMGRGGENLEFVFVHSWCRVQGFAVYFHGYMQECINRPCLQGGPLRGHSLLMWSCYMPLQSVLCTWDSHLFTLAVLGVTQ